MWCRRTLERPSWITYSSDVAWMRCDRLTHAPYGVRLARTMAKRQVVAWRMLSEYDRASHSQAKQERVPRGKRRCRAARAAGYFARALRLTSLLRNVTEIIWNAQPARVHSSSGEILSEHDYQFGASWPLRRLVTIFVRRVIHQRVWVTRWAL